MKTKGLLLTSLVFVGATFLTFASIQSKVTADASVYQQNFQKYNYFIETIGMVEIEKASLKNGKLINSYTYTQAGEVRHVESVLQQDKDGVFKGACTTTVNGKVKFAVNTWMTFAEDGTALGNWCWTGQPTSKDPIVKISKL